MEFVRKEWYKLQERDGTDELMLSFLGSFMVSDMGKGRNSGHLYGRVNVTARDCRANHQCK